MWFGVIGKGVYRSDGTNVVEFGTAAGLPDGNVTAKDLTEKDHLRLNGGVESIIQKGTTSLQEVLDSVRSLLAHTLDFAI